ncbi:MAG: PAC2 family protein, partial [Halobacteriales archaeon]|nr:PAC2 family protein [Halobacteriales archaeon]
LTLLVNELFVPVWAADSFAKALLEWIERNVVTEIVVLSGVPIPHGPEEHRVFYVATDDYREHRLTDVDVPPMGTGFLDGVNAGLIGRGIESSLRTGLFVTPVHPQTPDVEASIRLLSTFSDVYDLDVELEPLRKFASEVENYYRELAQRLETVEERHVPDDRMYM